MQHDRIGSFIKVITAFWILTRPCYAQFDDEDNPYDSGLVLTVTDASGLSATRVAPFLAIHQFEHARLKRDSSGSHAEFSGFLRTNAAGEYRFHIYGQGEIRIVIAGQEIKGKLDSERWFDTDVLKLAADYLPLEVRFDGNHFMICWSGPRFGIEPVPARLLFHLKDKSPDRSFERGEALSRVLRCGACHGPESHLGPGPSLVNLAGRVSADWMEAWLSSGHTSEHAGDPKSSASGRRMPAFGFSQEDARAITHWLLTSRPGDKPLAQPRLPLKPKKGQSPPDAKQGEQFFVSLGCLACHSWNKLGSQGWYGGGELSLIAEKRPVPFFYSWLKDPSLCNPHHRMPTFDLTEYELLSLTEFLSAQKRPDIRPTFQLHTDDALAERGRSLVDRFRCASCHELPKDPIRSSTPKPVSSLGAGSRWDSSCSGEPDVQRTRPGYRLPESDAKAIRVYFSSRLPEKLANPNDASQLLVELNCLACHTRQGTRETAPLITPALPENLVSIGKAYPALASNLGALTPPSLNSIGDKLRDEALKTAIARQGPSRRPYLSVRMPRFSLSSAQLESLTKHLIQTDRVPPRPSGSVNLPVTPEATRSELYRVAGGRLVSGDGFGCTSCHRVGSVEPPPGPASARGPDLAMLGERIRKEWYDRWVRDPARIVPRMEMPALQIPVAGVLEGNLDEQISAVWEVLNTPGFEPPPPAPVRVMRHTGHHPSALAHIITDIVRAEGRMFVRPFLIGLGNRHNILFDFETTSLSLWIVGDTARQLTKGKAWYWDAGGTPVLISGLKEADVQLGSGPERLRAVQQGQYLSEPDSWHLTSGCVSFTYRLRFESGLIQVERSITALLDQGNGFEQRIRVRQVPAGHHVLIRLLSDSNRDQVVRSPDSRQITIKGPFSTKIKIVQGGVVSENGAFVQLQPINGEATLTLRYETDIPVDRLPVMVNSVTELQPRSLDLGPGILATRLPLSNDIMPTGLSWSQNGELIFSCLKGRVFLASDRNHDGIEDSLMLIADGLPAPYGVYAGPDYIDVASKPALYRISRNSSPSSHVELLASGWGYTLDYHDWAIGLPRSSSGEYFLGIPCEQDRRSASAAQHHGEVLKLVPRQPTPDDPRRFKLVTLSRGSRFPMGLALSPEGELFVSDNQGNYTPFNEINHVRPGVHFGFINSRERDLPLPQVTSAAIDIPHPWCRSVNGIAFLTTPGHAAKKPIFGPFEGHMVGCEFNEKRLVRMTLEKVDGEFQGAAYPLTTLPKDPARGFLGPVVCNISPHGALYVGSLWDSGWGGGNNVGEIVRIQIEPDRLPCGIREVRALPSGFRIDFTRPVNRQLASEISNYSIESYRREPTPAYGGPDLERRKERITRVSVSGDGLAVTLSLPDLRPGYVYEFHLKNLAPDEGTFFPSEAYYTLRKVPR